MNDIKTYWIMERKPGAQSDTRLVNVPIYGYTWEEACEAFRLWALSWLQNRDGEEAESLTEMIRNWTGRLADVEYDGTRYTLEAQEQCAGCYEDTPACDLRTIDWTGEELDLCPACLKLYDERCTYIVDTVSGSCLRHPGRMEVSEELFGSEVPANCDPRATIDTWVEMEFISQFDSVIWDGKELQ